MARDRGGPGIAHQSLIYPATDLSGTTGSYHRNANALILSTASIRAYRDLYLGPDGDSHDWRASPLLAPDHRGLPPAVVILAGHDPLHDEGARYAETLRGDRVAVTVSEYPAMPHGFVGLPRFCRDAVPAVACMVEEQRRAFSDAH
jgi:acetyl esterase